MKVGILTSSRADFGIYLPLLLKMKGDSFFELEIIAFGTHLSKSHGYTIKEIIDVGFSTIHSIASLISNDDEQSVATSYALTSLKFADFWAYNKFDLVFCLGDRFEMSAAIQAAIPFGITFAHLHGGETTLGAIDNIYRHQITLASKLHFTATEIFSHKVADLIGTTDNVYNVGSLSIEDIKDFIPMERNIFLNKYNIPQCDYVLVTFHPETVAKDKNKIFAKEMSQALGRISKEIFLVISMPNADTMGYQYRDQISNVLDRFSENVVCIENFGKLNYFNAIYHSKILIGNSSSGIIEAASFGKYVVNVGDRQKGRIQSKNVVNARFSEENMLKAVRKALKNGAYKGKNIYYKFGTSEAIINVIKSKHVIV